MLMHEKTCVIPPSGIPVPSVSVRPNPNRAVIHMTQEPLYCLLIRLHECTLHLIRLLSTWLLWLYMPRKVAAHVYAYEREAAF